MSITQNLIERARANKQRIVLPEALEERTLTAADKVLAEGFADSQTEPTAYRQGGDRRSGKQS